MLSIYRLERKSIDDIQGIVFSIYSGTKYGAESVMQFGYIRSEGLWGHQIKGTDEATWCIVLELKKMVL